MAEVILDEAQVITLVGEREPARVTQHVRVDRRQPSPPGRGSDEVVHRLPGERLAAFKVPAHIWFYEEPLPRNPAGKVLKRDLRDEVLGERSRE